MDFREAIVSQYLGALAMVEESIRRCPLDLWQAAPATGRFWQIAYHALFYTQLYLQESEQTFHPWQGHRAESQYLGPVGWDNNRLPEIGEPYTQEEMLEYVAFCREEVERRLHDIDFGAPSGFDWLPFNKLELQVYNIRHLQQHIGELDARLSERGIETGWVGSSDW